MHTQTRVHIRAFAPEDYPALTDLTNAVFPEYPGSVEETRFSDERRDPRCRFARFLAEQEGRVVGAGVFGQRPWMFHPRRFFVDVNVHPEAQGQGIGAALYDHVMEALAPTEPLSVTGDARADWTRSLRFLAARGFVERMRSWESRLAVVAFDFAPWSGVDQRVRADGLDIRTITELAVDPDRDRKLYELERDVVRDVPQPEPHTPISYDVFVSQVLEHPDLLPDAYFVAIDRATGEYAGTSQLWHSQASDDLYNGLTGVRRHHRRRGIALALKLRGIAYARAQGRPTIKTWNEANNRPMLAINEALGFVKQPAWINFVNVLREEPAGVGVAEIGA